MMSPQGGLSILAAPLSIGQQAQARRDTIRANNRQAKMDILRSIIAIAGGMGPTGVQLNPPAPPIDYAGEMRQVGADIMGGQGAQAATQKTQAQTSALQAKQAAEGGGGNYWDKYTGGGGGGNASGYNSEMMMAALLGG